MVHMPRVNISSLQVYEKLVKFASLLTAHCVCKFVHCWSSPSLDYEFSLLSLQVCR